MPSPASLNRPGLRWWYAGVVALCVFGACMFALSSRAPATDVTLEKVSVGGRYLVSLAPQVDPIPVRAFHTWRIHIRDLPATATRTTTLRATFDGRMPLHRHGLPSKPRTVAEQADSTFLVQGVKFSMGGWWQLLVRLESGGVKDSVIFNLNLE